MHGREESVRKTRFYIIRIMSLLCLCYGMKSSSVCIQRRFCCCSSGVQPRFSMVSKTAGKAMLLCKGCRKAAEPLQSTISAQSVLLLTPEVWDCTAVIPCSRGSKSSEELMHFSVLTALVSQVMNSRSSCSHHSPQLGFLKLAPGSEKLSGAARAGSGSVRLFLPLQ